MDPFKQRFTQIEAPISQRRRLPIIGRVRLGVKVQKQTPRGMVEYPKETEHFVVDDNTAQALGTDTPTELSILLPSDDQGVIFPQALKWYGSSAGLKCTGNMVEAERFNAETKVWEKRDCPCEHLKTELQPRGDCTQGATLLFMIPRVSLGGVFALRTGSYHSIVDLNSGLDFVRGLAGRVAMVPLTLRRVKRETHHDQKRQTHYTLSIGLDVNVTELKQLRDDTRMVLERSQYLIEALEDKNPALDAVDEVAEEGDPEPIAAAGQQQKDLLQPPTASIPDVSSTPQSAGMSASSTPPAEQSQTIDFAMNPDPAERAEQAKLSDPYPMPTGVRDAEIEWERWHADAQNYPVSYTQVLDKLKVPKGKTINRALRREFKRQFEELLSKGGTQ